MTKSEKRFGHASKCCGISMFPAEFTIKIEKPECVTDDDMKKWDENFEKFMKEVELYFNVNH